MLDILHKMFGRESSGSKDIAKERLRLVLVHDRVNVSPQFIEMLKEDIVGTISQYMEIDEKSMEVTLSSSNSSVALIANIPVRRMKRGVNVHQDNEI
jgi:cell division topological specificity factor